MVDKKWMIFNNAKPGDANAVIGILLSNRGIVEAEEFVNPQSPSCFIDSDFFGDQFKSNLKNAILLIQETMDKNRPIIIHGDYDADGQTATAILYRTFRDDLKYANVFYYIPNRFDEGYGLSADSINGIIKNLELKNVSHENALLLTVDCGIVSINEAKTAQEKGFKVLISDHHQPGENFPESDGLVWTDKATGAGIAWIIANQLLNQEKYCDLGAVGTICDLQPLTGFNRSLAKRGLEELKRNPNIGIKVLNKVAGGNGEIAEYQIGWVIGPRLNATGRLESATASLELLITDDYNEADKLAQNLNSLNTQRQEKTRIDLDSAILDQVKLHEVPNFIVSQSSTYHEGVIGLVAGRLVQTYYRPAIAISVEPDKDVAKGSARSIEGISIIQSLRRFGGLFEKIGGHDMAAGFSIKKENIEQLRVSLNELKDWDTDIFVPKLKIDCYLPTDMINIDLVNRLNTLRPFGVGNMEPVFYSKNLSIYNLSYFGKENSHLKIYFLDEDGKKFTGLMFGARDNEKTADLKIGQNVDVAYMLSINEWNGYKNVELKIRDLQYAGYPSRV